MYSLSLFQIPFAFPQMSDQVHTHTHDTQQEQTVWSSQALKASGDPQLCCFTVPPDLRQLKQAWAGLHKIMVLCRRIPTWGGELGSLSVPHTNRKWQETTPAPGSNSGSEVYQEQLGLKTNSSLDVEVGSGSQRGCSTLDEGDVHWTCQLNDVRCVSDVTGPGQEPTELVSIRPTNTSQHLWSIQLVQESLPQQDVTL